FGDRTGDVRIPVLLGGPPAILASLTGGGAVGVLRCGRIESVVEGPVEIGWAAIGWIEGIAAASVIQHEGGDPAQVLVGDGSAFFPTGEGGRRPGEDEVGAQTLGRRGHAYAAGGHQGLVGER